MTAVLLLAIVGCSGEKGEGGGGDWEALDKEEQVNLRVMYWSSQQFMSEYGMLFASEFPNVEIEVVSRQGFQRDPEKPVEEALSEFMEKERIDVAFLLDEEYERLASKGQLLDLEPAVQGSSYSLEGFNPAILAQLRSEGDGKLYGLSPFFTSKALFYNIDLFEKYKVELPRDSMTWEEVFELAKRFPTDGDEKSRIYGFTIDGFMSPLFYTFEIGAVQNLGVLNDDLTELQLNSPGWENVFEMIVSAVKSGAFYLPSEEEVSKTMRTLEDDRFITGRSAMTFQSAYQIGNILYSKNQLKNVKPVNWGIVTAPVDPNNRTQSSVYEHGGVFAIPAKSSNYKAAWEFIKYANSAEYAKIKANSNNGELFSRTEFNRPQDGREIDAFYKLEPKAVVKNEFAQVPQGLDWQLLELISKELTAAAEDKKTLDAAIGTIQEEGQALLVQRKSAQK